MMLMSRYETRKVHLVDTDFQMHAQDNIQNTAASVPDSQFD